MVKRPRVVPLFSNVLDVEKVAMVRKLVAVLKRGQAPPVILRSEATKNLGLAKGRTQILRFAQDDRAGRRAQDDRGEVTKTDPSLR
jgi:hypothetical protein